MSEVSNLSFGIKLQQRLMSSHRGERLKAAFAFLPALKDGVSCEVTDDDTREQEGTHYSVTYVRSYLNSQPFFWELDVKLSEPHSAEIAVSLDSVAIRNADVSYSGGNWVGKQPASYGLEAPEHVSCIGVTSVGDQFVVTRIRFCRHCLS